MNLVKVTATDTKLAFSSTALHAGNYTFRETNSGKAKHALTISAPGLTNKPTGATLTPARPRPHRAAEEGQLRALVACRRRQGAGLDVHITVS